MWILLGVITVLLLVGGVAGAWLLRRLRIGQRHLSGALELAHRQLTELRDAVEEGRRESAAASAELRAEVGQLRAIVEPQLEAARQARRVGAVAREVEQSRAAGTLEDSTARELIRHLTLLEQECAAGAEPY